MAEKRTVKPAATRAKSRAASSPPRVRCPLRTIDDVKVELARLYRQAKSKKVDSVDASRMANMLSILARLIEGADLERRIEAIEVKQREDQASWQQRQH